MDFHFGVEVNDYDLLWVHGSVGAYCFRWILRRFWRVDTWMADDDWNLPAHIGGDE